MTKVNNSQRPLRVGLISLGCAKNLVDAEIMLGALLKDGVEITNDPVSADAVIVNTCSFIDAAQEESVDAILESAEVRAAKNRGQSLIVSGCLPQRFREELPKLLPEVDAFMGIDQVAQVTDIVRQAMARRTARLVESRESNVESRKSKAMKRLAEIDKKHAATEYDPGRDGSPSRPRTPRRGVPTTSASPSSTPDPRLSTPLVDVNQRPTFIPDFGSPRFRLTPRHFAYVKIAEGCNHPCSFCIIPRMRGSHRSRPQSDIVAEAKALLADGVKELNLISQDSTYYGLDLRPKSLQTATGRAISSPEKFSAAAKSLSADAPTICTLLRELNSLKGDFWIRLLYTHPAHWTDELISTIADCPKVARYVDIPLQHIHENMLERMRRETSRQYIVDLLAKIRAGVPGIALRTTFIVGFPGETEASFNTLLDFIRETKFERLGVFAYSKEDGTRAGAMTGQIPDKVKQQHRKLAMAEQHTIARQVSESFVGRTLKVLVEGRANEEQLRQANVSSWEHGQIRAESSAGVPPAPGQREKIGKGRRDACATFTARGEADAPDIDGRVYIRAPQSRMPVGEFTRVKIVGHTDYDLIAEPA
ncbi:MAG: 30S ribosomal protein S12 methylthiotransferase RimO [Verrucomicrobiota bacterium]